MSSDPADIPIACRPKIGPLKNIRLLKLGMIEDASYILGLSKRTGAGRTKPPSGGPDEAFIKSTWSAG